MDYAFFVHKSKIKLLAGMIAGIFIGTVICNCLGTASVNNLEIYYKYVIEKIATAKIEFGEYFWYVFFNRIKEVAIVVLLGLTSYRLFFHTSYAFLFGVKISIIIAILTMMKGKIAILWILAATQPQMTAYIYLLYRIICIQNFEKQKADKIHIIKTAFFFFLALVIICIIESFLNIFIISKIV